MEAKAVTYQYFLLGDTVPVRVAFNAKGLRMGAEVPNREKGMLVQDATYRYVTAFASCRSHAGQEPGIKEDLKCLEIKNKIQG